MACGETAATPHAHPARPAPVKPASQPSEPYHDPDHARGELPTADARRAELGVVRSRLDAMYAHRLDKEQRYSLDENALFAQAEAQLVAATSWAAYDTAIYDTLAKFHDTHLTYHPPATAAPKRGYTSYHLGLATVLARDHLLVASVEPGGDVAAAGVAPGDEVIAIDRVPVADVLARTVAGRVWSRPESAKTSFAKTWTSVLYPVGDPPRKRELTVRRRTGGDVVIAITPREAAKHAHDPVSVDFGELATVTIRSLEGGKARAKQIDDALDQARAAKRIVIDLRGDRGGDLDLAGFHVVAGLAEGTASLGTYRVLVAPETLAKRPKWKGLTAGPDGYSPPQDLTVPALAHGFKGPVAVVVDAGCVSTCEVIAAALRADVHAIVVGETTGGSSGAPVEIELPTSHAKIAIPTWNLIAADGHPIEGDGVVPDVDVVATPDALAAGQDLPLETAKARVSP